MPSRARGGRILRHWEVFVPKNNLVATRDITWKDVKDCVSALNESGDATFAPLHRCEGGFMCVKGPNFESNERVDAGMPHQNPPTEGDGVHVRKEIRFAGKFHDWPSENHSFLDNPQLTDDWVVMKADDETGFIFRGDGCVPWTKKECKGYAETLAQVLDLTHRRWNSRKRARC